MSIPSAALLDPKRMREALTSHNGTTGSGDSQSSARLQSAPIVPRYKVADLLNPNAQAKHRLQMEEQANTSESSKALASTQPSEPARVPQFIFDSPGSAEVPPNEDDFQNSTLTRMIEGVHGVTDRKEPPTKKLKLGDHSDSRSSFLGRKGGEIAEEVKQKRKEVLDQSKAQQHVVDLTEEDDQLATTETSTVQVNGNSLDDTEVCYGNLESAKVNAFLLPFPNPKGKSLSKTSWPAIRCQLHRNPGRTEQILVYDASGNFFAKVDILTSRGLAPLMDNAAIKVRTEARLYPRTRKPYEIPGQQTSDRFPISINIYGPRKYAEYVGNLLKRKEIVLRNPITSGLRAPVYNPHGGRNFLSASGNHAAGSSYSSGYVTRTAEEMQRDISGIFDSLDNLEALPEQEADDSITTPLLKHQKQALHFMIAHESPPIFSEDTEDEPDNKSLWKRVHKSNGSKAWYHVITGQEVTQKPEPVLGGILADMMGLGKTLSVLALIASTSSTAKEWAQGTSDLTLHLPCIKTTLLVCPLSVVSNWEEQIASHVKPGTLDTYIYHQANRSRDLDFLGSKDIVITTYNTVASEISRWRRKDATISPLLKTAFFRIVLDEAHMIREQTTQQSKAICALMSRSRWALTGTPVQNRLDDLGALIKFLRVTPLDETLIFNRYILSPFKIADPEILPKLRLLVDSVTLRRTKDKVNLPCKVETVERLLFSREERELYDWFVRDAGNRLRAISANRSKLSGKGFHHMLRSILCLRLVSAHGKELLNEEDLKLLEGLNSANAIDLDSDDEAPIIGDRQAYEMLDLYQETDMDICAQCSKKLIFREGDDKSGSSIGTMLPCYKVVCCDCGSALKEAITGASTDDRYLCQFCEQAHRVSFFELTIEGQERAEEEKARIRESPKHAKMMGRYQGPHTKTIALIGHLNDSRNESEGSPSEPPIKSVVFSGWTTHLDLIEIALADNNFAFARLDGKMSAKKRKENLLRFKEDPEVTVMLVSISAGGLGLNLTTANKVYVMEPQYNPAAEAQAVDRVHRLGQERDVTCVRFIMENSIEEKMLELQRKKQALADLSLNRGRIDRAEAARQKLEDLKSLFK